MKAVTFPHSFILATLLVPVTAASGQGNVDAGYKLARTEARAAYTEALQACHQHASQDVRPCRERARQQYEADLDRARERFIAAKQMQPLVTPQDYFRNDRREAWAAYGQAKDSCQQMSLQRRSTCMEQAKRRFNLEMLEARADLERRRLQQGEQHNMGASPAGETRVESGPAR